MEVDAIEESEGKLGRAKRVALFVIAPALIAGLFSLLPTIYTILTTPRAELSYTILSGPAIPVPQGFRRIFGAEIQNTGKIALNHVEAKLNVPNGQIESLVVEDTLLRASVSQETSTATIPRMLPGEQVRVSVMTISSSSEASLMLQARSDEAVAIGQLPVRKTGSEDVVSVVLGAVLSAISVALMSIAVIFKKRVRLRAFSGLGDKADLITFVAGVSRVLPMHATILTTEHDLTYARLADMFLFVGLRDYSKRERCVAGIQALVSIKNITNQSLRKIRENLEVLGRNYDDAEFDKLRKNTTSDIFELRRRTIDLLLVDEIDLKDEKQ